MTNLIKTVFVKETLSTNELAKEILKEKSQAIPFVVQADYQTKGKGQYLKIWESNSGENLLCSLVVKAPNIPIEQQFKISKAISVAIQKVLKPLIKKEVCIKWPNDIYVGDKKIAGILIENTIIGQKLDTCIIGIGLNINQTIFSEDIPNPTSVKLLTSSGENINTIKDNITKEILFMLNDMERANVLYDQFLYRKGELGEFLIAGKPVFLGVILGVDKHGKLCIRIENNEIETFSNNEVQFVLPKTN